LAAKKGQAAKLPAAALLAEAAEGEPVAGTTAALPRPTVAPSQDKLKAENIANV
jgi:hypothetical protein